MIKKKDLLRKCEALQEHNARLQQQINELRFDQEYIIDLIKPVTSNSFNSFSLMYPIYPNLVVPANTTIKGVKINQVVRGILDYLKIEPEFVESKIICTMKKKNDKT